MSRVGVGQTTGKVESALSQEGGDVTNPDVAVTGIAEELVPNTVASPPVLTLTTDGVPETHFTAVAARSWVVLSRYVPVAEYCNVAFLPKDMLGGFMARETSGLVVTVKTEVALIVVRPLGMDAVKVAEPTAKLLAKPVVLTVATVVLLDDQVAVPTRGPVAPLE